MYPYDKYPNPEFLELYNQKLSELQELIKTQGLSIQVAPGGKCLIADNRFIVKKGIVAPEDLPDKDRLQSYQKEYNQAYHQNAAANRNNGEPDFSTYGEEIELIPTPSPDEITIDPYPADFYDLAPEEVEKLSCQREAQLYAKFCTEAIERIDSTKSRTVEWQRITEDYNHKRLVPDLFKLKGERQERTLRDWVELYISSRYNMYALINKNKHANRGRKVTYYEQNFLLNKLLGPNQVKIGSAITQMKSMANLQLCESPSDERTLRRWCEEWAENHPAEWNQTRKGSKFVAERIIKSIIRDDDALNVGDVWVADGHVLAFDILNPATGKGQRMTMIMVMDWASRYPVGASLAFTEDSQHILTAFRNGFLNASILTKNNPKPGDNGFETDNQDGDQNQDPDNKPPIYPIYNPEYPLAVLPKFVYLDNGRAFKSKLFNEKWENHDLSDELGGIFPRLNIGVTFAESYNAKAKIIERFFKTFQEQFERFISTFRGACIADKPATLMRNEKWARKLYEGKPPTIEETMQMIAFYVRYCYGEAPHSALKRRTPYQVFSNAIVKPDRQIEANRLNFLMLAMERKSIRSEGLRLNHKLYWHEALIDHVGQPCVIRYDFKDARWILVYTKEDKFICQAELRRAQHPFIKLAMDNPIAHKDLDKEYKQIKKMRRTKEQNAKAIVVQTQEACDRFLEPYLQASRLITNNETPELSNQMFTSPPMISPPPKSPQQLMDELQQKLIENAPKRVEHTIDTLNDKPAYLSNLVFKKKEQPIIESNEAEQIQNEYDKNNAKTHKKENSYQAPEPDPMADNKSWNEMLKFIGIK
jgi:hypothetical protein